MFRHQSIVYKMTCQTNACTYKKKSNSSLSFNFQMIHRKRLCLQRLGQSSNLLVEQILGLLPDASICSVLELQQARHQSLAEHFRAFTGEERGKVVNADHAKRGALSSSRQGDGHGGLVEGGRDIVNGNGVVRVGTVWSSKLVPETEERKEQDLRVSAHVTNDGKATVGRRKALRADERRDLSREVDAVDEDISILNNLFEGAAYAKSANRKPNEMYGDKPFLVSSISQRKMSESGIPTSLANSTAPLPQRPSYAILAPAH